MSDPQPKLKVLSLGMGVQSWTLAAMSALGELPKLDVAIHADTSWEREGTYEFTKFAIEFLESHGIPVVLVCSRSARNPVLNKTVVNIPAFFHNKKGKIGKLRRQCTNRWKINPVKVIIRQELAMRHIRPRGYGTVEQWIGISWDEADRAKNSKTKYIVSRHPFLERETRRTRQGCIDWLNSKGLPIPPKSSCTHCPFHSKLGWEKMKREGGADWKQAVWFDNQIRSQSTKYNDNGGLYVHNTARPLELAVNISEDQGLSQSQMFIEEMNGATCDIAGYCWD